MKMIALPLTLTLIAAAGCAPVQTMPTAAPPPPGPEAPLTQAQIDICLNYAKTNLQWKDRESLRVEEARWNGPGGPNGGQVLMMINGKNAYGGYVGQQRFMCGLVGSSVSWRIYPW